MSIISALTSVVVSIFTFVASFITPYFVAPVPEIRQDDFVPVMRFLAASDTHIDTLGDRGCRRLSAMIKTAYAVSDADADYQKLDAVVVSGDITGNGLRDSFYAFAAITNNEIREGTECLGIIAKAHDSYIYAEHTGKVFSAITKQEPDFHRVIGGYHFIGVSRSETSEHYTEEQIKWLDENIAAAVKDDPEKPVFVFQHEHVKNTVYGSSETDGWGMDVFTAVLEKYPQVVHISGHSHFPANDPRAIWQGSFTAINDGGLKDFELAVDGKNKLHPKEGSDSMTQALIIEVDADNRVLVKVIDIGAGTVMREFLVDNITEQSKTKYSFESRKKQSAAPVFSEGASLKCEKTDGKCYITVPQATVSEDNEVFVYRISLIDENGEAVYEGWEFSQYFFSDMPESITFELPLSEKNLTARVIAEDVWGNRSDFLEINI